MIHMRHILGKILLVAYLLSSVHAFASRATSPTTTAPAFLSKSPISTTALLSTAPAAATAADTMPEIKVGDKIPVVKMTELTTGADRPVEVDLAELIAGKKVAIFGVPGAFTPGCSKSHLPSFMTAQDDLKSKGVELTICVATNDAFVMEAWGRTSGGSDAGIRFLSDSSGDLTHQMGLSGGSSTMLRTKRFSLIADDGVVTHFFNADKQASDTWAPNVLSAL